MSATQMRSLKEIRRRIAEIQGDERMGYKSATVFENAPLALIQTEGEAVVQALRWVLGEVRHCAGSYPASRLSAGKEPQ